MRGEEQRIQYQSNVPALSMYIKDKIKKKITFQMNIPLGVNSSLTTVYGLL